MVSSAVPAQSQRVVRDFGATHRCRFACSILTVIRPARLIGCPGMHALNVRRISSPTWAAALIGVLIREGTTRHDNTTWFHVMLCTRHSMRRMNDGSQDRKLRGSGRGGEPRASCRRSHPYPGREAMAQAVEEFLQSLPEAVQQRLQEVKGLHGQYEELEQEYTKEIEQIEAKYAALYREAT